jgi:RNA polymerase sigma-70 factor (ECF subfamily)
MSLVFDEPQPGTEDDDSSDSARERAIGSASPGLRESNSTGPERDSLEKYSQIVRPLLGTMLSIATRILGDEVQAWDAVQEVSISFWLEPELPANPRAWLTRATTLRSLHLARCRTRRRRHERQACERRPEASNRDEPSGQLEFEELTQTLSETFLNITPEARELMFLRMSARMDYASIAEALHLPIGTVRSRLHRTRQLFRAALSRDVDLDSSVLRDL